MTNVPDRITERRAELDRNRKRNNEIIDRYEAGQHRNRCGAAGPSGMA